MADDFYGRLAESLKEASERDWRTIARPNQLPPPGDWSVWLLLAGRGFGKTRVLSESVIDQEANGARRIAAVAATSADARDVLVEGESGILACAPSWNKPVYEPSKRRLTWKSGCLATLYSADEADRLRGPQHDFAIVDELAAWRYPETWDMLMMGLRLGKNPRVVVATTPKPTKLIRDLVGREGKDVAITRGSTYENRDNLAPQFLQTIVRRYAGSRLGRQELDGELLTDTPGALWTMQNLEETRISTAPAMQRIVVAIDPSGSGSEGADECGIVVCGLGVDSHAYVLADLSGRMSPTQWSRTAIDAYRVYQADRIVAETNYGGAMVLSTIASVDSSVPTKAITSSRGKTLRAEPVSALFEQARAHLVGMHQQLEDQLTSFTSDYDRSRDGSPDRLDAMVFAIAELVSGAPPGGYFNESALVVNGEPEVQPACAQDVFGVLATTSRPGAAVALTIFARTPNDVEPKLYVIDWILAEIDEALTVEWLAAAYARTVELSEEWNSLNEPPTIYVEKDSVGEAAFDVCMTHLYESGTAIGLTKIDRRRGVPIPTLQEKVEASRAKINSGAVKLGRPAFEREAAFRGATTNHLLAQLRKFSPEARDAPDELVGALCTGVSLWSLGAWF